MKANILSSTNTIYERFKEKNASKLLDAHMFRSSMEKIKIESKWDEQRRYDKLVADFSYKNTKRALQVYHHVFDESKQQGKRTVR